MIKSAKVKSPPDASSSSPPGWPRGRRGGGRGARDSPLRRRHRPVLGKTRLRSLSFISIIRQRGRIIIHFFLNSVDVVDCCRQDRLRSHPLPSARQVHRRLVVVIISLF